MLKLVFIIPIVLIFFAVFFGGSRPDKRSLPMKVIPFAVPIIMLLLGLWLTRQDSLGLMLLALALFLLMIPTYALLIVGLSPTDEKAPVQELGEEAKAAYNRLTPEQKETIKKAALVGGKIGLRFVANLLKRHGYRDFATALKQGSRAI